MKTSTGNSRFGIGNHIEQRREPRHASRSEVRFRLGAATASREGHEVCGKMLNRSTAGFHAEHDCSQLTCGPDRRVRFQSNYRTGPRMDTDFERPQWKAAV